MPRRSWSSAPRVDCPSGRRGPGGGGARRRGGRNKPENRRKPQVRPRNHDDESTSRTARFRRHLGGVLGPSSGPTRTRAVATRAQELLGRASGSAWRRPHVGGHRGLVDRQDEAVPLDPERRVPRRQRRRPRPPAHAVEHLVDAARLGRRRAPRTRPGRGPSRRAAERGPSPGRGSDRRIGTILALRSRPPADARIRSARGWPSAAGRSALGEQRLARRQVLQQGVAAIEGRAR